MEKQLLTIKDTAAYLGVSQKTIRRMIADNEIAFLKVRGQFKISLRHLEGWIDKRMVNKRTA